MLDTLPPEQQPSPWPRPRLWTREEYLRMAETGVIGPEERIELIEGRVVTLSPSDPKHDDALSYTTTLLTPVFAPTHVVRIQMTFDTGGISMPEPDVLIVKRSDAIPGQYPTTGDLVIEVANSSLRYDREIKASIYARARILEYWILNVVDRVLEVHRDPQPLAGTYVGHAYASVTSLGVGASVSPIALPRASFNVGEML